MNFEIGDRVPVIVGAGVYTKLFRPVAGSRTGKVECIVCGKNGYDVGDRPRSWMNAHKRGHSPCPDCGKQLTLLTNGRPRTHQRCPAYQYWNERP